MHQNTSCASQCRVQTKLSADFSFMNYLSRKPVVIVGPTASGKSSVAMAVAQAESTATRQVHIVAVDAMQVYRDMNIGTAKPTKQDQALVPHHYRSG